MIYTPMTIKAMKIAYDAHHGQQDAGGTPYIFHPFHVAEQMDDEITVYTAILHDVMEDSDVTFEQLAKEFPPEVMEALRVLTRVPGEDYFSYVRTVRDNPIARQVKLADVTHNLDGARLGLADARGGQKIRYWKQKYQRARSILMEETDGRCVWMEEGNRNGVFVRASDGDWREIRDLVHRTVKKIYPRYYPPDVANFFCMLHSREWIQSDIAAGNVWKLLFDGRLIGTGSAEENHITRVYVLPEFQNRGHGTRIVQELEKKIAKNYGKIILEASLASCCLYEKMGYCTKKHEKVNLPNGVTLVYDIMEKKRM